MLDKRYESKINLSEKYILIDKKIKKGSMQVSLKHCKQLSFKDAGRLIQCSVYNAVKHFIHKV